MVTNIEHWWKETDKGKRSTLRRTSAGATSSTANLTRIDLRSNPGLRGERPEAERRSHGTV